MDESIQKLCGKITGVKNILNQKIRYQNEINEKISDLFGKMENKEMQYTECSQAIPKTRVCEIGSQINSDTKIQQLINCPVDLVSIMSIEKEIDEIEAENANLIQTINELSEQLNFYNINLQKRKETSENLSPNGQSALELENLKVKQIKLEEEKESVRYLTKALIQNNAKLSIELIEMRDKEFKAAVELEGAKQLTEFEMTKLEEKIRAEDTQMKSLTRKYQELFEHEKLLESELKSQQLVIFKFQKEISDCEVSLNEKELKIAEAKEIKRTLVNRITRAKSNRKESEAQMIDAREKYLHQEYPKKENTRRV